MNAQLNGGDALGWLVDMTADSEKVRTDGAFLDVKARKRAKAQLIAERTLLKRCAEFLDEGTFFSTAAKRLRDAIEEAL